MKSHFYVIFCMPEKSIEKVKKITYLKYQLDTICYQKQGMIVKIVELLGRQKKKIKQVIKYIPCSA